jgi:hypothetical protein
MARRHNLGPRRACEQLKGGPRVCACAFECLDRERHVEEPELLDDRGNHLMAQQRGMAHALSCAHLLHMEYNG